MRVKVSTLFLLLASVSMPIYAQTSDNDTAGDFPVPSKSDIEKYFDDFYTVELIIFRRNQPETQERAVEPPVLDYPDNLLFLSAPPSPTAHGQPINDGDQNILNTLDSRNEVISKLAQATIDRPPSIDEQLITMRPPLMQHLQRDQHAMNSIANRLDRRSTYTVLFHHAWHQQLGDRSDAAAIPIFAGDQFGEHLELEGYIKVSKSRFLHLDTELWLSRFTLLNNPFDQRPWHEKLIDTIALPMRPKPKFTIEQPYLADLAPTEPSVRLSNEITPEHERDTLATIDAAQTTNSKPRYGAIEVSRLAEHRRLKRDEIHYLDHPNFGVIVVVKKFDPELPQAKSNTLINE